MKISVQATTAAIVASSCILPQAFAAFNLRKSSGGSTNNIEKEKGIYVGAIITIDHVEPAKGPNDEALILDALVRADDQVNPDSAHFESGFVEKTALIPEDGDFCPPNDDKGLVSMYSPKLYGAIMWSWVYVGCSRIADACSDDDDDDDDDDALLGDTPGAISVDVFAKIVKERSLKKKALEQDFCEKIRQSGYGPYASITKCSIDFVYSRDKSSDGAMVHHVGPSMVQSSPFYFEGINAESRN